MIRLGRKAPARIGLRILMSRRCLNPLPPPHNPMQSTALIIRPNHMPNIRVLEADGPFSIPDINHFPGTFLPVMSYEEWLAQPDHLKAPVTTPGDIKFDSACRIARLLDNAEYQQHLSARHLREIRWRLEELHPCCTGDILRSVSNSVPA